MRPPLHKSASDRARGYAAPRIIAAGFSLRKAMLPVLSCAVATSETEQEMCVRHVREGEEHVSRQRRIVAELRAGDHPTALAEQLLAEFEKTLDDHRAHLARVLAG